MKRWIYPLVGIAMGTIFAWALMPRFEDAVRSGALNNNGFVVRSFVIADTKLGRSPIVLVDREISKQFTADWTLTVRKIDPRGLIMFCTRSGRSDYLPGQVVPLQTDLNFWMSIPPNETCPPMPLGRYAVTVVWVAEIDGKQLITRVESNEFEVIL